MAEDTTEYEYRVERFDMEEETVELPTDARGTTVSTFGDRAVVRYLAPASAAGGAD